MKILIVASGNGPRISPFIIDQIKALKKKNVKIDIFLIIGKGVFGYLKNYNLLLKKIKEYQPNLIHAHYGLSGLLSSIQRRVPVVTTFHGSDINKKKVRPFSRLANILSKRSIYVSKDLSKKLNEKHPIIIPCGVDMNIFHPLEKTTVRKKLGFSLDKKYILFSSSFDNKVKNYPLAKEAISKICNEDIELLQLQGYKREEVSLLMNAVDVTIMTSFTEGSPQFIKEAMACNTPIVSVNVGDVKDIIGNTEGCYLAERISEDVSDKIRMAIKFNSKTKGRYKVMHLDNVLVANRILEVYDSILHNKNVNY